MPVCGAGSAAAAFRIAAITRVEASAARHGGAASAAALKQDGYAAGMPYQLQKRWKNQAQSREGQLLGHCRQPTEHIRGCWVVDLILGKV